MLTRPVRLVEGDRVAAVTLSWGGAGAFPWRYEAGARQLEDELGLRVEATPHCLEDPDWIRDHPEARAEDLMAAFRDPGIRAIVSTIGGDDSLRILPHVDLDVIRANPKVVLGYSDATVTHFACLRAGLGSFYGPSILSGFAENGGMHRYAAEALRRLLIHPSESTPLQPNPDGWTDERLDWADPANQARRRRLFPSTGWRWTSGTGVRTGPLIGGCLEVLTWMRGSAIWPSPTAWDGAVVFLECAERGITPAKVEGLLAALDDDEPLRRASAVLVGRPRAWGRADPRAFEAPFQRRIEARTPLVSWMDFGHTDPMLTLPYGVPARVDCEARSIELVAPAVL